MGRSRIDPVTTAKRILWALLLSGCAAAPQKTVTVTWDTHTSCGARTKKVTFVDSGAPALDCLRFSPDHAALLLVGMPIAACSVWDERNAMIYMAMSDGFAKAVASAATLESAESILTHELKHGVLGKTHNLLNVWNEDCK